MPPSLADEVLADPIAVLVDLVAEADTGLDRDAITGVVTGVAGGRAKRRRLAQALLDKPSVLTDGRSPAPRAIAELLLALRKAGAAGISAPVCTDCDKPLRTFHRLEEHWYCWTCVSRPQHRCASCGRQRTTATLDRHGQPRCAQCPDRDDRDPMLVLTAVIRTLEPTLPTDAISVAVGRVFSKPGYQRRLAWTIEDRPALLTGQAAQAPMAGVLRLIDELHAAGAQTITRPTCPR